MDLYDPKFLDDRVYQGFWHRYEKPGSSELILTLSIYRALLITAILVVAIEYGGSRVWVILRFAVYKMVWKPLQMDEQIPDRLRKLSAGRAVMNTFAPIERAVQWLRFKSGAVSEPGFGSMHQHDPGQSAWYGLASLINIIVFIFLGIALPIYLNEGTLNPPTVKTRPLPQCLSLDDKLSDVVAFIQYAGALAKTDAILGLCQNSPEETCLGEYHFVPPQIQKRRLDSCPFPGPVCYEKTKAFEITHLNVTGYELGYNSHSKLSFSHRTTCAPVITQNFMLLKKDFSVNAVSARTTLNEGSRNHTLVDNFSVRLLTPNGPNTVSKNSSGLEAAWKNEPSAVRILPTVDGTIVTDVEYQGWDYIHQDIRRKDGHSFLIVNIAGRVSYDAPVDDPFFAAHNTVERLVDSNNKSIYYPDYEATTIACFDQYEFCIPGRGRPSHCSGWGDGDDIMYTIFALFDEYFDTPFRDSDELVARIESILVTPEGRAIMMDAVTFVPIAVSAMSLHQSLAMRNRMMPASGLLRDQFSPSRRHYGDEQWVLEIETWFAKAIIDAILRTKLGARSTFSSRIHPFLTSSLGSHILMDWSSCGRVLFRNASYTNINVIGFFSVLGASICLSIMSYQIEHIFNAPSLAIDAVRSFEGSFTVARKVLTDCVPSFKVRTRLPFFTFISFQPSVWVPLVLSQLGRRTRTPGNRYPRASAEANQGRRQHVPVENGGGPLQSVEDIYLDDIEAANLRLGEEIDHPLGIQ